METHTIKQGDTSPSIRATLKGADNAVQDLTGATVKFNMRKSKSTPLIVDHGACVVEGDATDGVVRYDFEAADTATKTNCIAEFEVTFADGRIQTFPNSENFTVSIVEQVG